MYLNIHFVLIITKLKETQTRLPVARRTTEHSKARRKRDLQKKGRKCLYVCAQDIDTFQTDKLREYLNHTSGRYFH